jgi:cytochrome P450
MSLPPGPSSPAALQTLAWVRKPIALLEDCRERFGHRFTLRFVGGRDYVLFSRPADVKTLFQLPAENFRSANEAMKPFLGEYSLFTLEGERHRRHRRLIGPPLRGERLHPFARVIDEVVAEEIERWPVDEAFPIIERMRDVTLRIIFRAVFGVREPGAAARLAELVKALTEGPTAMLAFVPLLRRDLGAFSPWGRFRKLQREFWSMLADEVRAARGAPGGREDILARLLQEGVGEGDPLTDEEIVDELVTLLAAGHETSTSAIAWAFQYILGDAAVERALVDEIRAGTAASGGRLDHAALERMPGLESAVWETLRMLPIVPIVPRLLAREVTIDDVTLPAGTFATACAYLTQHDPAVFPDPETFRADRFVGKRGSPFELYPFGGGHRHCIGGALAMYEIRAILAAVLGRVKLRRPDLRPQAYGRQGITVTPRGGTPVILEKRL